MKTFAGLVTFAVIIVLCSMAHAGVYWTSVGAGCTPDPQTSSMLVEMSLSLSSAQHPMGVQAAARI